MDRSETEGDVLDVLSKCDTSTDDVTDPLRYSDDRIPAIEFEGRKYRSNALLNKAMRESEARRQNEQAGEEALSRNADRLMDWIFNTFFGVFALGLLGLPTVSSSFMPLWLAISLMVLGSVGTFLLARLRDKIHDARDRYHPSKLRWFDSVGRPQSGPYSRPPRPNLPR